MTIFKTKKEKKNTHIFDMKKGTLTTIKEKKKVTVSRVKSPNQTRSNGSMISPSLADQRFNSFSQNPSPN